MSKKLSILQDLDLRNILLFCEAMCVCCINCAAHLSCEPVYCTLTAEAAPAQHSNFLQQDHTWPDRGAQSTSSLVLPQTMLKGTTCCPLSCMQQTSGRQNGRSLACERLPITIKHSSSHEPRPPPSHHAPCPPAEDTSMLASPCIIPCCAAEWPQVAMDTCMSPAKQEQQQQWQQQQRQAEPQSDHIIQQPLQQQQQCGSEGSQHSRPAHTAQSNAPRSQQQQQQQQQQPKQADMATHCHSDRGLGDSYSPISWAAQNEQPERLSQNRGIRAASSGQEERGRQQETCGRLGRHGSDASVDMAQDSSRVFLDGLRPCSPSERCSPETAAHAHGCHSLTGQLCLSKVFCVIVHPY